MKRLLTRIGDYFLPVLMGLIVVGLILIVGVEIGRRKERTERPVKVEAAVVEEREITDLCLAYVTALGDELESTKKKYRLLLEAYSL